MERAALQELRGLRAGRREEEEEELSL